MRLLQRLVPPDLRFVQRKAERGRRSSVHVPFLHSEPARENRTHAYDSKTEFAAPGVGVTSNAFVVLSRRKTAQGDGRRAGRARARGGQAGGRDAGGGGSDDPSRELGGQETGNETGVSRRVQGPELPVRVPVPIQSFTSVPEDRGRGRVFVGHLRAGVRERLSGAQHAPRVLELPGLGEVLPAERRVGRRGRRRRAAHVLLPPDPHRVLAVHQAKRLCVVLHLGVPAVPGGGLHPVLPPEGTEDPQER